MHLPVAALILGIGTSMSGCNLGGSGGSGDSSCCDGYPADSGMWTAQDNDDDGFTVEEGDCDDSDATVHPDATEVLGDGIDSNCDGEDDT